MNTRELATQYRMAEWADLLRERSASGESIKDFCDNRGISRNTYFYWQRKLRAVASAAIQSPPSDKLAPAGWVACEAEPDLIQTSGISIEIGKCRVMVGAGWDSEMLGEVCRVLAELC